VESRRNSTRNLIGGKKTKPFNIQKRKTNNYKFAVAFRGKSLPKQTSKKPLYYTQIPPQRGKDLTVLPKPRANSWFGKSKCAI